MGTTELEGNLEINTCLGREGGYKDFSFAEFEIPIRY